MLAFLASGRLPWPAVLLATVGVVRAQTVTPSNETYPAANLEFALVNSEYMRMIPVVGLTPAAASYASALQGPLLLGNASSQLAIAAENIVLISCDPYQGIIQPAAVLVAAQEANATAVVLYTELEDSCGVSGQGSYSRIYTVADQNSTMRMLQAIAAAEGGRTDGTIAPREAFTNTASGANNGTSTDPGSGSQQSGSGNASPLGPSPSTAVAMIILYSITGIITALFLLIIVTGAVRAHRHPERYGPRNGIGRPRQSRAKGLAMAMLETIPIVKFGDRTGQEGNAKTADVELAGHEERDTIEQERSTTTQEQETGTETQPKAESSTHPQEESGIAAAEDRPKSPPSEENSNLGCSICTEDFKIGEDQRVLPCDHRFHPACIDPWLLNVSGTCPLCRIDLRPATSQTQTQTENEVGDEEFGLAPPLDLRRHARRSLFGAFTRPERMTREERVLALRQYRARQGVEGGVQPEERGLRERLRGAFRVRTRRTGDEQEQQQESVVPAAAAASTTANGEER